jgi:hypothetical protein
MPKNTHTSAYLRSIQSSTNQFDDADEVADGWAIVDAEEALLERPAGERDLLIQNKMNKMAAKDPDAGSTMTATGLAIAKSFVGPAVLYLPHGFQQGGKIFSPIVLFTAWALCMFGSWRLLQCWRITPMSFGHLCLRILGKRYMVAVRFCLAFNQVGRSRP